MFWRRRCVAWILAKLKKPCFMRGFFIAYSVLALSHPGGRKDKYIVDKEAI